MIYLMVDGQSSVSSDSCQTLVSKGETGNGTSTILSGAPDFANLVEKTPKIHYGLLVGGFNPSEKY